MGNELDKTNTPADSNYLNQAGWDELHYEESVKRNEDSLEKIKAIKVTGDIAVDSKAFFEAAGWSTQGLPAEEVTAIESGDKVGLLRLLKDRQAKRRPLPEVMAEGDKEYFTEVHRVMDEIIEAAEKK